ncbi:MAG TPA: TNT domain-containing protein, partial [Beutenbergiaceae bacterium]|nr:TNT domain-containing protein [Beutenbergiaceae bacterium]
GVWLSARVELNGAEPQFIPNYHQRVYWNSPTMLTPPTDHAPIPTDEDWSKELRRNPRHQDFYPEWVPAPVDVSQEFHALREALTRAGFSLPLVRLPGETHQTFEGALLIRQVEGQYSVDVFDYGQVYNLGTTASAKEAGSQVWNYLTAALPPGVEMTSHELVQRANDAAETYHFLNWRLASANQGGIRIGLATGVPYDRWGGVDGLYFFQWGTPLPARSLPPSATEGAERVVLIANEPIDVQVERAPAWFGEPGGGIRFRAPHPIRQLVHDKVLTVVNVVSSITPQREKPR